MQGREVKTVGACWMYTACWCWGVEESHGGEGTTWYHGKAQTEREPGRANQGCGLMRLILAFNNNETPGEVIQNESPLFYKLALRWMVVMGKHITGG